jgi:septal ring factor EnvC (AmiA/AmiB activator)
MKKTEKQMTKNERKELINSVEKTIETLTREGKKIDFSEVASKLGVARSTLYRNPTVRSKIISARNEMKTRGDILLDLENRLYSMENKLLGIETALKEHKRKLNELEKHIR